MEGDHMDESILTSIKKLIGITEEDESFDVDIIIHINNVFSTLRQIGVGPKDGFSIHDKSTTWSEYSNDQWVINKLKPYVYLRVKIIFDPPTSSSAVEALNKLLAEEEWRLNFECDVDDTTTTNTTPPGTIVQGSNDPIVLQMDCNTESITDISAILYQHDIPVKQWRYSDVMFGVNELILPMTEELTSSLTAKTVTLETKWKLTNGNIDVGDVLSFNVIARRDSTRLE